MIGLAAWADANTTNHLWAHDWFQVIFFAAVAMTLLGLYGFVEHWKLRSIPPVLVGLISPLLFFHVKPLIIEVLSGVAFLATAYFVSPDRDRSADSVITVADDQERDKEIESRNRQLDEAYLKLDAAYAGMEDDTLRLRLVESERDAALSELAEIRASQSRTLLRGEVVSFAGVDYGQLTEEERIEFDVQFLYPGTPKFWYVAHIEIEAIGVASRARDWKLTASRTDGTAAMLRPFVCNWGPPPKWPRTEYLRLDEIQSMYLDLNRLYHVIVYIQSTTLGSEMNYESFQFAVTDSNGNEIVCGFRKAERSPT